VEGGEERGEGQGRGRREGRGYTSIATGDGGGGRKMGGEGRVSPQT